MVDFYILDTFFFSVKYIETGGISCPLLKKNKNMKTYNLFEAVLKFKVFMLSNH